MQRKQLEAYGGGGKCQLQFVLDYSVQVCEAFSSTTTYIYTANDHQRREPVVIATLPKETK